MYITCQVLIFATIFLYILVSFRIQLLKMEDKRERERRTQKMCINDETLYVTL